MNLTLEPIQIPGDGILPRRSVTDGQVLGPDDPAIHVVTDFTREHPATVDEDRQIDDALADMVRAGVRALLVVRDHRIVGLVTSYDIQGERPLQFLQSSNYSRHEDIRVIDVMTPWDQLVAIDWRALQRATARELLQLFEETRRTHLLVVDTSGDRATCVVRALASRARLERQLTGLRRTG